MKTGGGARPRGDVLPGALRSCSGEGRERKRSGISQAAGAVGFKLKNSQQGPPPQVL